MFCGYFGYFYFFVKVRGRKISDASLQGRKFLDHRLFWIPWGNVVFKLASLASFTEIMDGAFSTVISGDERVVFKLMTLASFTEMVQPFSHSHLWRFKLGFQVRISGIIYRDGIALFTISVNDARDASLKNGL